MNSKILREDFNRLTRIEKITGSMISEGMAFSSADEMINRLLKDLRISIEEIDESRNFGTSADIQDAIDNLKTLYTTYKNSQVNNLK